eukprot:1153555-Pelagomonas_calceolata.AAC.1
MVYAVTGRGNSPYINLKQGETLAQESRESPPPQSLQKENANGDLEGSTLQVGSTWTQNLAVRGITVFISTSSGNKLVGILNQMGMKFMSKFNGTLMVQSDWELQLLKLVKGVLSITSPTNAQEDSMKSHSFCTDKVAEVCMLPLSHLQLAHVAGLHVVGEKGKGKWKSYANGSHLKRHIKEGLTPTATRAQTRIPLPPGRGRVFDTASHFNPPVT